MLLSCNSHGALLCVGVSPSTFGTMFMYSYESATVLSLYCTVCTSVGCCFLLINVFHRWRNSFESSLHINDIRLVRISYVISSMFLYTNKGVVAIVQYTNIVLHTNISNQPDKDMSFVFNKLCFLAYLNVSKLYNMYV